MSMTDIKTDPTLAEWIGIHDELILIVNKLIAMQDELGQLRKDFAGFINHVY